ncbi:MAG: hypothetical protein JWN46_3917 [Acidimicrobiales bacterium]|nr:hypothetical protein [Acidimicrobiales bacterium]
MTARTLRAGALGTGTALAALLANGGVASAVTPLNVIHGTYASGAGYTIGFPKPPFKCGEKMSVGVAHDVRASDGLPTARAWIAGYVERGAAPNDFADCDVSARMTYVDIKGTTQTTAWAPVVRSTHGTPLANATVISQTVQPASPVGTAIHGEFTMTARNGDGTAVTTEWALDY